MRGRDCSNRVVLGPGAMTLPGNTLDHRVQRTSLLSTTRSGMTLIQGASDDALIGGGTLPATRAKRALAAILRAWAVTWARGSRNEKTDLRVASLTA